jgi:putative nucleotidyltransferase with HDIG domain
MDELILQSEEDYQEIISIFSEAINELKNKEQVFLKGKNAFLNMLEDVNEAFQELETLFLGLVRTMVSALDAKSPWTKGHSERVAAYAKRIAETAGLLHDIGKIGTYDYLLDKPEKLTDDEYELVKKHPAQGARILDGIKQLHDIIPFIKYHHERLDRKGYPDGLSGNKIPFGARILHVADSFDSMSKDRPYRPAPGIDYAISEFNKYSGTQFDSEVVKAFFTVLEKDGDEI